eukprot:GHUV01013968.1.p1 GENE.GHUV01013968.1~~GHUV01013968.1.p1  ORF type:complete len:1219 (+),score=478.50 GHUV01013968.1:437-4093(+)
MNEEPASQQGQPAEQPGLFKRTKPSISTILGAAPISHSKLPPLQSAVHSIDEGLPQQAVHGLVDSNVSSAATTQLPGGLRQSTADHETEDGTSMHMQQEQTLQQDHLLLRPPAAAAAAAASTQPARYAELPELPSAAHPSRLQEQPAHSVELAAQGLQNSSSWAKPRVSRTPKATQDDQVAAPAETLSSQQTIRKTRRLQLLSVLDSPATTWVLMMMTLFVIFQEDFKYAALPPSADIGFEAVTLALLCLFLVEIGLSCLVRPHFFLSFYFWLDTMATLSLAFELPALRAALLLGATQEYVDLSSPDNYLMAAGASALVSSKAGRAAKLVRLFRQLQLIRLFRQLEVRQRLKQVLAAEETATALAPDEAAAQQQNLAAAEAEVMAKYSSTQSRVGQRLSDLTMKRVITGILAMLIVLPALEITSGINGSETPLALGGLHMLHTQAIVGGANTTAFASSLQAFQNTIQYKLAGQKTGQLLYLVVANTTYIDSKEATQVSVHPNSTVAHGGTRAEEKKYRRYLEMQAAMYSSWVCPGSSTASLGISSSVVVPAAGYGAGYVLVEPAYHTLESAAAMQAADCHYLQSFVLVDIKWTLRAQSLYGIARTFFLACLLAIGAMLIHKDTFRLVLQPVQRMVERVKEMAEDPLMLAAARITAAPQTATYSASGAADAANSCSGQRTSNTAEQPSRLSDKDPLSAGGKAAGTTRAGRLGSMIRVWPSIQVHAVAGDFADDTSLSHVGPKQQHVSSRTSLALVAGVAARRLSAGVVAGVSAAGYVAARLRRQLAQRTSAIKHLVLDDSEEEAAQGQYETRLLEQSIYKICALLAVGFGDAGAEIIAENIKKEGDLNPIVPGKKTVAVFGFCDIRRFTDTTEVLQEGVMEFVNTIAHLVHGAVSARGGAANKNIGDAFLLVWKLPKGLDDRDINMISASGVAATPGAAVASRLKSATLHWPDISSDDEVDAQEHRKSGAHAAAASGSKSGSTSGTPSKGTSIAGGSVPIGSPDRLSGQSVGGQLQAPSVSGAEELGKQLQSAVHKDLTIKRAASGVVGLLTGNNAAGDAASGGSMTGPCRSESSSVAGIKRTVLNLKSVKTMPLSIAAKATIINTISDNALASFVVIQVAIAVSRRLKKYSNRADLNNRMPGFKVQMGFGLHVGWAIEGAIGSEYKIDASYLSPNVNLASRLEAATKQYGVPLLLSRAFVDCLSPAVRAKVSRPRGSY